ncbi:hypothetical protein BK708_21300 [Bacillus thuringiensis serovar yunnanensis]|nr:hypothetical protein BK708_21300 [Bacillus thuringiensis serovar yunnanensis]
MQLKSMYKVLATTFILGQTMVGPVLTHADTVPTNAGTHAKQQSNMDTTLGNLPFINLAIDGEDFGEKPKEDGKKYVEDRMKEQEKKMSVSEVRALKDFITKDENTINDYLFKNDGKLMDKDPLNTKIEKLDDILKAQRIDTSIKVYQTIPSMKIGSAQNLREKILTNSIYEITSLSKASGSDPLLEITVPKGSHAAYGMNGDSASLILERGSGLLVTDVKQITDKGITRIKIEAKILSSEEIRNREKDLSPQLKSANEMLTQKMGLPVTLHSYNLFCASGKYRELQRKVQRLAARLFKY